MRRSLLTLYLLAMFAAASLSVGVEAPPPALTDADDGVSHVDLAIASLDVRVKDGRGIGISGAAVRIIHAWSGDELAGTAAMEGFQETFAGVPQASVLLSVVASGYVPWMGTPFVPTSGATILNITLASHTMVDVSTMAGAMVSLASQAAGEVKTATADDNGSAAVMAAPDDRGWVTVADAATSPGNWTLATWDGSANVSVGSNETTQVQSLPDNTTSGTVRFTHRPSGWTTTVDWAEGELLGALPRLADGDWAASVLVNGSAVGEQRVLTDARLIEVDAAWLVASLNESALMAGGTASLALGPELRPSNSTEDRVATATWTAAAVAPGTMTLPSLAAVGPASATGGFGLADQIDRTLGDGDGILNQTEADAGEVWLAAIGWLDAGRAGCCWLDGHAFVSDTLVMPTNVDMDGLIGPVSLIATTWNISVTATLSADIGFTQTRLLHLAAAAGPLSRTSLDLSISSGFELIFTPADELVTGNSTMLSIDRGRSAISPIVLSLRANQAPDVIGAVTGLSGSSVPLNATVELNASASDDEGRDPLNCTWTLIQGTTTVTRQGMATSLNVQVEGFIAGSTLELKLVCADHGGMTGRWNRTVYVDATPPELTLGAVVNLASEDSRNIADLLNDTVIELPSGAPLDVTVLTSDDSGSAVSVAWSSNSSQGWSQTGYRLVQTFSQNIDQINSFTRSTEDRHQAKGESSYWLRMVAQDEAGNQVVRNWTVLVQDNWGPEIRAAMYTDGLPMDSVNRAWPNSTLTLDMNETYDDTTAIATTTWTIQLDDADLATNIPWAEAVHFEIGQVAWGWHTLIVSGTDEYGNTRNNTREFAVQPLDVVDYHIAAIDAPRTAPPGVGVPVTVHVENHGSRMAEFRLCHVTCTPYQGGVVANESGPGSASVETAWTFHTLETPEITLEWRVDENETGSVSRSLETITVQDRVDAWLPWVLLVLLIAGVVVWGIVAVGSGLQQPKRP